jgi:hypothetical protein
VGTGLAVAVVAASSSLRGGPRGRPGGAPLAGLLDGGDLRPALAGAAAAASGTGLLSFVVLDVLTGERAPGPLGIAMVPAVLAAVPAGRALHRLRQEGRDALAASTTISEFASRARRALARAVRAQAVAAGGGCAAGALVALLVARDLPAGRLALDLATVGLLAVALFLAGVLVALTRPGLAAAATGAGLAGDLALRALPAGSAAGPARLAAAAVLVAVLFRIAATQVERPFLHR